MPISQLISPSGSNLGVCNPHWLREKGFIKGQKLSGFSHGNLSTQVFNIIKAMTRLFWRPVFFYMQPFKHWRFSSLAWRKNNSKEVQEILHYGKELHTHTHPLSSMQEHNSSLSPGPFAQKWTSKKRKHKDSHVSRVTEHPENLAGPGDPIHLRHWLSHLSPTQPYAARKLAFWDAVVLPGGGGTRF